MPRGTLLLTAGAASVLAVLGIACSHASPNSIAAVEAPHIDRSRAALDAWLARIPGAETGKISRIDDDAVRAVFLNRRFYVIRFMRFPRAQQVPRPLKLENLVAVRPDGSVELHTDLEALKKFLKAELPPVRDAANGRNAAIASLRLAEEYYQDGFYTFDNPEGSVSVIRQGAYLVGQARSVVTRGGTGQTTVKLTFDPPGKVELIEIEGKVRPDVRTR